MSALDPMFEQNIYYAPEKSGFEIVDLMEDPEVSYEFSIFLVLRRDDTLYWTEDAGCSCPSPFEEVKHLSDLTTVDITHMDHFFKMAGEWATANHVANHDWLSFKNNVRGALRGNQRLHWETS